MFSESVLEAMPNVMVWLKKNGIDAPKVRYARYIDHIGKFFSGGDKFTQEKLEEFNVATECYKEISNIYYIFKSFQNEEQQGFIDRLKKTVAGQDLPEAGSAGPSRNFLFELSVASMFSNAGYCIDFNSQTDVIARSENYEIYIECKKLSSDKKLEDNFKAAGKQLEREIGNSGGKVRGIIFIDVTTCLEGLPRHELPSTEIASYFVSDCAKNFVRKHSKKINDNNDRFIKHSLGVCLISQVPVWIDKPAFFLVRDKQIIVSRKIKNRYFRDINKIGSSLNNHK